MYPTRLNLHNKHLPPTKKEIVHDKLRVGYGEPKIYGQSQINMSVETAVNLKHDEKRRYQLDYRGIADAKGLIYFIGTDGMQHPFENPSLKNYGLTLTVTKGSNKYGIPAKIVNRDPNGYQSLTDWKDIKKSYIEIDLNKKVRLRPNRYMIRSGTSGPNFTATDWVLEGIECDKNGTENTQGWKILKKHENDQTLFQKSCSCPHKFNALSYTINDDMNFGKTDGGFYSKFRIRLTSNNVNGNAYLSISSVEFWGVLEMI